MLMVGNKMVFAQRPMASHQGQDGSLYKEYKDNVGKGLGHQEQLIFIIIIIMVRPRIVLIIH